MKNIFQDLKRKDHKRYLGGLDLFKYIGPGLLVTVGFIDPGNWASNFAAGSEFGYSLLWVVTLSTIMLIVLQHNVAHLGIVTGLCLSEAATKYTPKWVSRPILGTAVLASISTSLAEILGGAIALEMLLDIPIFIKRYGNNLDWNYVQDNLKKLKLYDFANNILTVCNKWFGIKLPYGFDVINKSDLKIFENYILDGGVFGYTNRNVDAINGANNSTTFIGGLKSILERVFPSYDKLKERYAWFGSPPKMLLPLGWVRFWLYRLKYGKIGDIKRIGKIVEVSDDVVIHNSLMENLGLKEKRK